jgi:hypothetical protein
MSRPSAAAHAMQRGFVRIRTELAVWQEKATTLTSGRARTTGFEPNAVESAEAWALVDGLDSIAVNDPVALVNLGGKPINLGKVVRGTLGMARIRRQIALTGPAATITPKTGGSAGTGASTTNSDGNDNAGFIELAAGTGPAAGVILTITFAATRPSTKYNVILTPRNNAARSLGGVVGQTNTLTTSVDIDTRTALTASTTYQWGYEIKGWE